MSSSKVIVYGLTHIPEPKNSPQNCEFYTEVAVNCTLQRRRDVFPVICKACSCMLLFFCGVSYFHLVEGIKTSVT